MDDLLLFKRFCAIVMSSSKTLPPDASLEPKRPTCILLEDIDFGRGAEAGA